MNVNLFRYGLPVLAIAGILAFQSGCSSSSHTAFPRETPSSEPGSNKEPPINPPPVPVVPADKSYAYRAINEDCNCEEYRANDAQENLEYKFRARYRMDTGITTSIEVEVLNNGSDTLFFDHATVKVASLNIAYQYNNKFIPLPSLTIPPRESDVVKLSGKETTDHDDWHKIAGEQLTITVRGLKLGVREVKSQSVTFVPENPIMGK